MLNDCHQLQTLDLGSYVNAMSAKGLASLTHIRSMQLRVDSCASLQSVCMLTHLENLALVYEVDWEENVPPLLCSAFPHLVSLKVKTEWVEPMDFFQHLTQLQNLIHLSLETAAPYQFTFAALSRLTSLHMDNFTSADLEGLQHLPRLRTLDLLGDPTDEDMHMLARLTTLTALQFHTHVEPEEVTCHVSSVIKLSSLQALQSMHCTIVDGSAHYSVTLIDVDEPADAEQDAFMVISLPNVPFALELHKW